MGLYYNPIPPHIGAQQPLTQRQLTPPISGPAPQNPPFNGGAKIAQGILTSWAVAAAVAFTYPPVVAINLDPPIAGPAPQNPPRIGARVPVEVQVAWLPVQSAPITARNSVPLGTVVTPLFKRPDYGIYSAWIFPAPAPIVAVNLDPPVSGPAPQNPPVNGSRVPVEVQVAWIPPPPAPIVAVNLDPPQSGPAPQNPPVKGSRVPVEVQVAWLPPVLLPVVAVNMDPPISGPIFAYTPVGARVPVEVQVAWLPAPYQPYLPVNLDPPISGPLPQNPPFRGARSLIDIQGAWTPDTVVVVSIGVGVPPLPLVSFVPVGSRVPVEVQVAWLPVPYQPYLPVNLDPPISGPAPQNPPFIGTRVSTEVQVSWLPLAPGLMAVRNIASLISAPVVTYTPVGSWVPIAVQVSWLLVPPAPVVAVNLSPPQSGPLPQNPPFVGTRVPTEVQVSWLLVPPAHWPNFVADDFAPLVPASVVGYTPIGSFVPAAVLVSWLPVATAPQSTPSWFTPSAPVFPFPGSVIPSALWSWWRDPPPPIVPRVFFFPPPATFPFTGSQVPKEVLQSWIAPAPHPQRPSSFRTVSGPAPSQPPLGGGAIIRQEILTNWIPPPPAPIVASKGGVTATFSFTFVASWRVAVVPSKNKVAVVPGKNKVAVVLPKGKTAMPPRGT